MILKKFRNGLPYKLPLRFSFQVYGWLSAVITAQYASLRPTTFFVDKQEPLFRDKKYKNSTFIQEIGSFYKDADKLSQSGTFG